MGRRVIWDAELPARGEINTKLRFFPAAEPSFANWGEEVEIVAVHEATPDLAPWKEHAIEISGRTEGPGWLISGGASLAFPEPIFHPTELLQAQFLPDPMTTIMRLDEFAPPSAEDQRARQFQVQNVSRPELLESLLSDGTPYTAEVFCHLNAARWQVTFPAATRGFVIERLYDAFHGRQRARVLLNDDPLGMWYSPEQNRQNRWRWDRFGWDFEAATAQDAEFEIAIDPPAGAPLWSVSRYRLSILR